jgi:hypothetical protein
MTEPMEWRLHCGVHKTATTHLQDTLERQRATLAEAGISVIPRAASRDISLGRTLCGIGWRGLLPEGARRRMFSAALDRLGCTEPVMVWSDENLIGRPEEMLSDPMFPRLEKRLRNLAIATRGARHHLFLSVRDPADILPSVYAQSLRTGPPRVAFEDLLLSSGQSAALVRPRGTHQGGVPGRSPHGLGHGELREKSATDPATACGL